MLFQEQNDCGTLLSFLCCMQQLPLHILSLILKQWNSGYSASDINAHCILHCAVLLSFLCFVQQLPLHTLSLILKQWNSGYSASDINVHCILHCAMLLSFLCFVQQLPLHILRLLLKQWNSGYSASDINAHCILLWALYEGFDNINMGESDTLDIAKYESCHLWFITSHTWVNNPDCLFVCLPSCFCSFFQAEQKYKKAREYNAVWQRFIRFRWIYWSQIVISGVYHWTLTAIGSASESCVCCWQYL